MEKSIRRKSRATVPLSYARLLEAKQENWKQNEPKRKNLKRNKEQNFLVFSLHAEAKTLKQKHAKTCKFIFDFLGDMKQKLNKTNRVSLVIQKNEKEKGSETGAP